MDETELAIVRRAYAKQVLAVLNVHDSRVEQAFAGTPREAFLGPGPWQIMRHGRYVASRDTDPVYLYTDDLVAIDAGRRLNNGQPSLHAYLMEQVGPRPGEHAVHVGAGTGYYTALLGSLVGSTGKVTAIEYDPVIAALARANLASSPHVTVIEGDGTCVDFEPADVIYINAGTVEPAELWLDRLRDGGRLMLPLTTSKGFGEVGPADFNRHGVIFLVSREGQRFLVRRLSSVAIFPCVSLRDDDQEHALSAALARDDGRHVTRLYRTDDIPEERRWLRGPGWCLATT